MSPVLSVRGLAKRYGGVEAVRGVTFEVGAGEIFGLIGPNGAGKSTTLECVLGLCTPDAGEISIGGIDARADPEPAKEKLGAQLQASALPDAMTPRQALKLCASFYRRAARPDELIERFLLQGKADAEYASLSGGQRQRLALALAFVNEPEIVILDEPTAGLDPPARRELHALIAAQRAAGRTIVFTTHYLEEARTLCDRVALIDRGRLVALDAPEALIARSAAPVRIHVRTAPRLRREDVASLPGVAGCAADAGSPGSPGSVDPSAPVSWTLETAAINRTLAALAVLIESRALDLRHLEIRRPTLEDVFLEMTGR